jgi:CheY-like chemotaxis protein
MTHVPVVLVVEDDFETRLLLRVLCEREGFQTLPAEDGETALALIAGRHVDVILLDLLLPKVNGFEVMRHLRCTRPALLARTIVMTAATEATTRDCQELLHVFCFRRKPLDVLDLATDVRACARQMREPARQQMR